VSRHTDLVHATQHAAHTAARPALSSAHVGVDGSLAADADGRQLAAGAAVYYTMEGTDFNHAAAAHIITCTFTGEQTVANAECSACSLALQTLAHADHLEIGWDHLNAVTLMHQRVAHTAPVNVAEGPKPPVKDALLHYAGNPNMVRATSLATRDLAAGRSRTITYTKAHTLKGAAEKEVAELLDANAAWDPRLLLYVVPPRALQRITEAVRKALALGQDPAHEAQLIKATQNALADWGAKQVTAAGKPASTALNPNRLAPYAWSLVDDAGVIQQADSRSIATLISSRVGRALEQNKLHPLEPDDPPPRLNTDDLWLEESTRILSRPKHTTTEPGDAASKPPPEHLTKHFCQTTYGGIVYNQEAAGGEPALLTA
jgi:hypothetical protein